MYIMFWSIIFLVVGAFWQIIDARLGVRVYRVWYNLTHEHPLAKEMRQGFIANRGSKAKTFWAFVGSTMLCLAFVFSGDAGNFTKLILWLVGIPVIMIGFYFGGPNLIRLWRRRNAFFKKIDELERGDPKTMDWFRKTMLKAGTTVSGIFRALAKAYEKLFKKMPVTPKEAPGAENNGPDPGRLEAKLPPSSPPPQAAHSAVETTEPMPDPAQAPEDPREMIRRFTEGQR